MKPFFRIALLLTTCLGTAAADDPLASFRAATDDEVRFVVRLPPQPDEGKHQIELLVGREQPLDCNAAHYVGKLHHKTLLRKGTLYYTVRAVEGPVVAQAQCPDAAKRDAFVSLEGDPYMVRYDSGAPIVVYVPKGFEVRYRVWQAGAALHPAKAE
jgi:ecotin